MPAITIDDLAVNYGRFCAIEGLTMTVPVGAFAALVGNNGAGKTTTLHTLMGMLRPRRGASRVLGFDSRRQTMAMRQRVGFYPERDQPYEWIRVRDLMKTAAAEFDHWDAAAASRWLERFELPPGKRVRELSKGMLAKLKLAVALSHDPALLLLDEPTGGLDPGSRDVLMETVQSCAARGEMTVLWSTHLLEEVEALATHVYLLHDRRCLLAGETKTMREKYGLMTLAADEPYTPGLPLLAHHVDDGRRWVVVSDREHPACAGRAQPVGLRDLFRVYTGGRLGWAHARPEGEHDVAG